MTAERAVLAGGCFWGMQDRIRRYDGVLSTRAGYAGGSLARATYGNHGSHAEAVEVIFDPARISYREILEFFFQRRAEAHRRRHHCRCGCFGPVARQGGDGSGAGRRFLGGRAGASGLPPTKSRRLHVPFRPAKLEAAGTDIASLPPDIVMNADKMVDAALVGLDHGESVTIPSLPDVAVSGGMKAWHCLKPARLESAKVACLPECSCPAENGRHDSRHAHNT